MDSRQILAERSQKVEFSGIRKFFEMASRITDPCDLSIGLPDYDAPENVKDAAIAAIREGKNRYLPSSGLPELRMRIIEALKAEAGVEQSVLITSGVSGGLTLALLAITNPGDEIVFLDPYFVSYVHLVNMVGGTPVPVSSYPDFAFNVADIEAAITPKTKALMINTPGNPTGRVMKPAEVEAAVAIAKKHNLVLICDEIYDKLCYDGPNVSPIALAPDNALILRGFGKTYGMTGWRMGYAAGPAWLIEEMTKLHQYTYVCAPSMAQFATLTALETDVSGHRRDYSAKRDLVCDLLKGSFDFVRPGGGFYVFPPAPKSFPNATAFAEAAMKESVIVIPGGIFSQRDTHFRISYAASDAMLRRGCEVLCRLAR
ncbi:MAG: aminotransferase class I/II-fold pyridoxal phosphate-dependent enzyme [Planctomycetes bacterium]|nr:aminotransferase class I/II-fold pyridoxal phosphate-dependent enzyme [Planctomycetota bacterium]